MQMLPMLYFQGLADEALAYYANVLDAEVLFRHRVADIVEPQSIKPGTADRILRAALRIGGNVIYLTDGHGTAGPSFQGVSLNLLMDDADAVQRTLDVLAEGGAVQMPPRATTWSPSYGTVVDRYGLHWTIEVRRA